MRQTRQFQLTTEARVSFSVKKHTKKIIKTRKIEIDKFFGMTTL